MNNPCDDCPWAEGDTCCYPYDVYDVENGVPQECVDAEAAPPTPKELLERRKSERARETRERPDYGARCAIKRKLAEANDCRDIARAFDALRRIFDALSELYILGGGLEFYEREQYNFFTIYESLLKSLEEVIRNEKQDERH